MGVDLKDNVNEHSTRMRTESFEHDYIHVLRSVAFLSRTVNDNVHIKRLPPSTMNLLPLLFFFHYQHQSVISTFIFHLSFPNAQAVIFMVLWCLAMKTVALTWLGWFYYDSLKFPLWLYLYSWWVVPMWYHKTQKQLNLFLQSLAS